MERKNGKEIGDRIKRMRVRQRMTQDALAKKADIPSTLPKIEVNVITRPSVQTVAKIASGLEVSIDDLMR